MMNFLLGTVAGALIACIATIAAARHPVVQSSLGLRPTTLPLPMAASTPPAAQKPCAPSQTDIPRVGSPDMLFSKRRFWSVAP